MTDKRLPDDLPSSDTLSLNNISRAMNEQSVPWLKVIDPIYFSWTANRIKHNAEIIQQIQKRASILAVNSITPLLIKSKNWMER